MDNALIPYYAGTYFNPYSSGSPEAQVHWLNFLSDAAIAQVHRRLRRLLHRERESRPTHGA